MTKVYFAFFREPEPQMTNARRLGNPDFPCTPAIKIPPLKKSPARKTNMALGIVFMYIQGVNVNIRRGGQLLGLQNSSS